MPFVPISSANSMTLAASFAKNAASTSASYVNLSAVWPASRNLSSAHCRSRAYLGCWYGTASYQMGGRTEHTVHWWRHVPSWPATPR